MVLLAGGLLMVAALCANGRLPRNGFVGIRLPATMRTDAAWIAGHRAAAGPLALLGLGWLGVGGLDLAGRGGSERTPGLVVLFALAFGTWAVVAAHKAARDG